MKNQIKKEVTEEVIFEKNIEDFLNQKLEEYNLVENIKRPMQVAKKVRTSIMIGKPNIHHKDIKFSNISETYKCFDKEYGYSDLEPKEVSQITLPSIIRQEIRAAGINKIEWSNVKDLPMGMDKDIKNMGEKVFKSFGLKEGAAVHTISSFKDKDLLNSSLELNSVLGFLEKNAKKVFSNPATQVFDSKTDNKYAPNFQLYYTAEKAYLAIFEGKGQGMEGNYIYAFERDPTLSLKNNIEKIENKKSQIKLK